MHRQGLRNDALRDYAKNVVKDKVIDSSRLKFFICSFRGNGGSTMHAMHVLQEKYGWETLRQKRILLIHAGG